MVDHFNDCQDFNVTFLDFDESKFVSSQDLLINDTDYYRNKNLDFNVTFRDTVPVSRVTKDRDLDSSREFSIRDAPDKGSIVSSAIDYASLHNAVYLSGIPNFLGCRLPVPSRLHISSWRRLLENYHDKVICDFLEFGWPIGYIGDSFPVTDKRNHKGAELYPDFIDAYIATEIAYGAVFGPFTCNPFVSDIVLSPLNSVPKGLSDRRIILDLSWPHGLSVNDGIPRGQFLGADFELVYPTVDDIAQRILTRGSGCCLFKRDLI
jgi:hypothetical protein